MNKNPEALWLHMYSGKENGLMVIGSPAAMRTLGQQLVAATENPAPASENWPQEIASPHIVGPYSDAGDFKLSFHFAGSAPLSEVVPICRRNLHPSVFLAITACTLVGAVTIWQRFLAWVL